MYLYVLEKEMATHSILQYSCLENPTQAMSMALQESDMTQHYKNQTTTTSTTECMYNSVTLLYIWN